MTTLVLDSASLRANNLRVGDDSLTIELADARTLTVPLAWYPRLLYGTPAEREDFRFIGGGEGIHWPALDENISVEGLIAGRPSGESPRSLGAWIEARTALGRP